MIGVTVISHIDHLVLTVRSQEDTLSFYERVLGFERVEVEGKPAALHFGVCKISVHEIGHPVVPKARRPTEGSADFCLITITDINEVVGNLEALGVAIEAGPVRREGAQGSMVSVYFRDPDENLVEVSRYEPE